MIRILYMSDLHLEMERMRLKIPGWADFSARRRGTPRHPVRGPLLADLGPVDLVVMAGDIHKGLRGEVYAEQVAAYLGAPVVTIAGNHEYYHFDIDTLLPSLRRVTAKTSGRVRFLENDATSFTFRGETLHVLGATLWTDYRLRGNAPAAMAAAQNRMNDHNFIELNGLPFRPRDAEKFHQASRAWLQAEMATLAARDPAAKKIIVTHHAPSARVLGQRQGDIAPAYASDILAAFARHPPELWIHGHTHHRHDSVIEGIHLVSAPRGYVNHDGPAALAFRPGIIDI